MPHPVARIQAWFFEVLPGDPVLSRDNLDSMKVSNVASGALPGLARLGIRATALEAIAPQYLGRRRWPTRLGEWRAAIHRR